MDTIRHDALPILKYPCIKGEKVEKTVHSSILYQAKFLHLFSMVQMAPNTLSAVDLSRMWIRAFKPIDPEKNHPKPSCATYLHVILSFLW